MATATRSSGWSASASTTPSASTRSRDAVAAGRPVGLVSRASAVRAVRAAGGPPRARTAACRAAGAVGAHRRPEPAQDHAPALVRQQPQPSLHPVQHRPRGRHRAQRDAQRAGHRDGRERPHGHPGQRRVGQLPLPVQQGDHAQ
ncbi:hypothetical protein [Streptomyces thioluteus]|uniref:hypothetical protein n=1 Tax=Streptomyces thioluteus TaxID=66431 RepID=UPI003CD0A418